MSGDVEESHGILHNYQPAAALQFIAHCASSAENSALHEADSQTCQATQVAPAALRTNCPALEMVIRHQKRDLFRCMHGCTSTGVQKTAEEDGTCFDGLHEKIRAHSQVAVSLSHRVIANALRDQYETRIQQYDEALLTLAEMDGSSSTLGGVSADGSEGVTSGTDTVARLAISMHRSLRRMSESSNLTTNSLSTNELSVELEEGDLEHFLARQPFSSSEVICHWLARRYRHCCDVMSIRPSDELLLAILRSLRRGSTKQVDAFPTRNAASPLSAHSPLSTTWLTLPSEVSKLRGLYKTSYDMNLNVSRCRDIGTKKQQFIALLGVLESVKNAISTLRMSDAALSDGVMTVLLLFMEAHLRRLQVLDISYNAHITERSAATLKRLASSLPLLSSIVLTGTSLSASTLTEIDRILFRKAI